MKGTEAQSLLFSTYETRRELRVQFLVVLRMSVSQLWRKGSQVIYDLRKVARTAGVVRPKKIIALLPCVSSAI